MRKTALLSFVLLLAVSVAAAQTAPGSTGQPETPPTAAPGGDPQQQPQDTTGTMQPDQTGVAAGQEQQPVRGCLVQEGMDYFLIEETSGQRWRLENVDANQVRDHINHVVEVRGSREQAGTEQGGISGEAQQQTAQDQTGQQDTLGPQDQPATGQESGVAAPEQQPSEQHEHAVAGTLRMEDFQHVREGCAGIPGAPSDQTGAMATEPGITGTEQQPATETQTGEPSAATGVTGTQQQPATETQTGEPSAAAGVTPQAEQPTAQADPYATAPATEPDAQTQAQQPATEQEPGVGQQLEEGAREVGEETQQAGQEAGEALGITDQDDQQAVADQRAQVDDTGAQLPQTASPLPLLMLLGFGSLLAGYLVRRK